MKVLANDSNYKASSIDLTMSFDMKKFISTPTVEELNLLKKSELLQLAQRYELMVNNSVSKTHIKKWYQNI